MKSGSRIALTTLATTVAIIGAIAPPATASDGPLISSGPNTAKYYGATDTFRVCDGSAENGARVEWKTASLSGSHTNTSNTCRNYDHAFVKGTKVTYRLCDVRPQGSDPCSAWQVGYSDS